MSQSYDVKTPFSKAYLKKPVSVSIHICLLLPSLSSFKFSNSLFKLLLEGEGLLDGTGELLALFCCCDEDDFLTDEPEEFDCQSSRFG